MGTNGIATAIFYLRVSGGGSSVVVVVAVLTKCDADRESYY